jgi:hypothetical protein
MPRTQDAAAESDSITTLCGNCSKALQKPLMCARCKTATFVPRNARFTHHTGERGGLAIKAVIDYSNAHTNTNVTE